MIKYFYMNKIPKVLLFWLASTGLLFAESNLLEKKLEEAIRLTNLGKNQEAIAILKKLTGAYPDDDRVFLSLGLVYRSDNHTDQAIAAFEKAVDIKPSLDGYYSLGLLYEAKAVSVKDKDAKSGWLKKAFSAWNHFLKLNPKDTRKLEVAERHIRQIKEQPDPF